MSILWKNGIIIVTVFINLERREYYSFGLILFVAVGNMLVKLLKFWLSLYKILATFTSTNKFIIKIYSMILSNNIFLKYIQWKL